ncbi:MAG: HAMP domain-containing protein [Candidatus Pacebacteria bacterium]|nr:HAMP domain-containing protein [Candidatus Paceibacterota bacterium]
MIYNIVGVSLINYNANKTDKNGVEIHLIHKLIIQQKEAELSIREYYLNTNKHVEELDLEKKKEEIWDLISKFENLDNDPEDTAIASSLKTGSDEFFNLADEFINLHRERLNLELKFEEQYKIEKEIRYSITDSVINTKDNDIIIAYYEFSYKGKEALYQYKDEKHFNDWKNAIINFRNEIKNKDVIEDDLIEKYYLISENLERIVLKNEKIKLEELEKLSQIRWRESVLSQLQNESDQINVRNTEMFTQNLVVYGFILLFLTFILIIAIGYLVAYYISNPINEISKFAEKIGKGDYEGRIKINSNDEIGKTAKAFNTTLDKVKESNSVLEIKVNARTKRLKDLTDELDNKVKEKTDTLKLKVKELEKFNNLAIDRELKMIDLKKEIKELKQKNLL